MNLQKYLVYFMIVNIFLMKWIYSQMIMLDSALTYDRNNISKCVNDILIKYSPCGSLATFVNPNINVDMLIQKANEENICQNIIVRSFDDRKWFIWSHFYIITAENLLELRSGMLKLTRDLFWNPRAKFIIQINDLDEIKEIEELFKILLKYKVYDLVLLRNLKQEVVIYTYYPYHNHNCGKSFNEVVTLGTCKNAKNITEYFSDHDPENLKNCTIRVVATDDVPNFISRKSNYTVYGKFVTGLEQYLLDTVAKQEGFFIEYTTFNPDEMYYGIVLPNGTSTGLLHYIDNDKAEVAAGGYILMKNRVELFDYLYGFNYASYYLYTPAIGSNVWQRLYREFGILTWCLIGLAFVLIAIIGQILKIFLKDDTYSILNTWGFFFTNANTGISANNNFRVIVFFWSWFSFFIVNFYNTALFSLTSVHVHERPHSISPDNLKALPYKPCISDNSRMLFQFAFNQELPEGPDIYNCTFTDGALQYVAVTKKYYAIEMEYSYTLQEYKYVNNEGKPKLDSWTFSSSNMIVMYLVRGFPYKENLQKYASRMYETGLIKRQFNTIRLRTYTVNKNYPKSFKSISLSDLRLHFSILLLGYLLSFLCFIMEVCHNYMKLKNIKRKKNK